MIAKPFDSMTIAPSALPVARIVSMLKQSCSHGGHTKWPPARAELRVETKRATGRGFSSALVYTQRV